MNACEDLLWRLGTDNAPFVTHEDQYKEAIRSRTQVSQRERQIKKPVLRFVAALVVVALLLGGAEVFLYREGLEQTNTDDQQQHIVQGFSIDPELVEKTIADEKAVKTLNTTDYQKVREFLGFDLPQNIFLNDWEPKQYYLNIQPTNIQVVVMYLHKDNQHLQMMLDLRLFTSIESAFVPYEQDQNGTTETLGNISVYFSDNYGDNTAVWTTNNCAYWINSRIEKDMLRDIIQQIIGGSKV